MVSYAGILPTAIDQDSPLTTDLASAWSNNLLAAFAADYAGDEPPRLKAEALDRSSTGSFATTTMSTYCGSLLTGEQTITDLPALTFGPDFATHSSGVYTINSGYGGFFKPYVHIKNLSSSDTQAGSFEVHVRSSRGLTSSFATITINANTLTINANEGEGFYLDPSETFELVVIVNGVQVGTSTTTFDVLWTVVRVGGA